MYTKENRHFPSFDITLVAMHGFRAWERLSKGEVQEVGVRHECAAGNMNVVYNGESTLIC
ncbi:hypothetical protein CN272_20955 [Bacillus anthracis]|nr:hypothetical protein CN272_20955 [Bacillus anthracis]